MKLNTYQKLAVTTVFATLFLIFVGGLVRAAGAGLGCPDWPKCFGLWVPPLDASGLPSGYDSSEFNVFKTWTEYINRLVGVVIGLLITATFALSFRYRKKDPPIFYNSAMAFLLVLIQGWLGGRVVVSGLDEWLITLHMVLAVVIVNVLLYTTYRATGEFFTVRLSPSLRRWLLTAGGLLIVLSLLQLIFGTQVREMVDVIKNAPNPPPRSEWIGQVDGIKDLHRSFSWVILVSGAAVWYLAHRKTEQPSVQKLGLWVFLLILFQILLGAGLYYLGMPPSYQVFHLLGSVVLICLEFLLFMVVFKAEVDGSG